MNSTLLRLTAAGITRIRNSTNYLMYNAHAFYDRPVLLNRGSASRAYGVRELSRFCTEEQNVVSFNLLKPSGNFTYGPV
jgi:hypothetical protein